MKKILPVIILLIICSIIGRAQPFNHVPNPSFEQNNSCNSGFGGVSTNCVAWRSYNTASPDYYHVCNGLVPSGGFGYKFPAHGDAFVGFVDHYGTSNFREYIAAEIVPLTIGKTYEVSMSVSVSGISKYFTEGLAVHFYDSGTYFHTISGVINMTPKTNYDNYGKLSDTSNWVRLTTSFVADSAYDNIVIGNFYTSPNFSLSNFTSNFNYGYIFIDSVVVKLADTFDTYFLEAELCAGDSIEVPYSIFDTVGYNGNTNFIIQLSDASGSFANPTNVGSKLGMDTTIIYGQVPLDVPTGSDYRLRVISVGPNDTAGATTSITITNLDSADIFVGSNVPVCEDENIYFVATHNSPSATYSWAGPLMFSSTLQNPTIISASPVHTGAYYNTVTINGCTHYDTLDITVKPKPTSPVIGGNTSLCTRDTLQLTAGSTTGSTYSWTGPNSFSSNNQNPTVPNVSAANGGTYTVSANLNGCVRSSSTSVTVLAAPENTVANSNTPLCVGETLNLTATNNTSGVSYSWSGPNSYSSNSQNPSITNTTTTQSGAYIATYSLNGCVEKDTVNVAVNIVPATPVVSYNTPLCVGETLNLSGTSTTSGVSYSWAGPNSFGSNSQNPTKNNASPSDTGTYTLTTTMLNCSSSPASIKVDIRPTPFVVMYTNDDSICKDETVTFNSLANNASGNVQYQWYVNAQAISGATQTTYTANQLNDADVIYCRMIDNASCSVPFTDESNDIQITVLPWLAPSVSITVSPQGPIRQDSLVTFTATAVDAGNPIYQWKRNGQDVQGATGQTWAARTLNNNDVICVEIESGYRCPMPFTASSNCITAEVVSVDNISNIRSLKLYPNPNAGQFLLEGRVSSAAHYDIQIVNAVGQVVYRADVATRAGSIYKSMDVNLASGVYLLQLQETATKQTQTIRLIIK